MSDWVLVDRGKDPPTFFEKWVAIGPCGTWDQTEAARFPSERAAMQSPAYSFPLTFYRPVPSCAANSHSENE